jgi:glycosyltransferase involved in cell wall biosynthesis
MERNSKIWIFSEIYFPEETSTGYIMTEIAEELGKETEIEVVTGYPAYFSSNRTELSQRSRRNNVVITRFLRIKLNKNKLLQRSLRAILISLKFFFYGLRKVKKGDAVLLVTNPPTQLVLNSLLAHLKKAKLVVLVHDVFPDNLVAAGLMLPNSISYKLINTRIIKACNRAVRLIAIGRDMKEILQMKLGTSKKIDVIPNWAELERILPSPRNENSIIKKLNLTTKKVFLFAGNLGRVQGLEVLTKAIKELKDKEYFHFIFVGNGAKSNSIETLINSGVKNVSWLKEMPRNEQQVFLNACDIGIISLSKGMKGLGVPSKVYNILAAGKPVFCVVEEGSEIELIVKEHQVGWIDSSFDPTHIANSMIEAANDKNLDQFAQNARRVAEDHYSKEKVLQMFTTLFKNL